MVYEDVVFDKNSLFLVTGCAGFICSNLCETLINKGYKARCLDNLSTGKRENMDDFINHPNFEFINGDIRDNETCNNACKNVDYVLHQVAWESAPRSIEMPLLYHDINIKGTLNMLETARQNKVKKFIYAFSSFVYGDEPNLPKFEGREGNLLSPYALAKGVNEEYSKLYTKLHGLDTYGLRYFNVFGKRQDPNGSYAEIIPKWINQLLKDERPTINGDGLQIRDFTYIKNVIEANLKACKASSELAGEVYNIASGGRVAILDIYNYLCKELSEDIKPIYGDVRKGDIKNSYADISIAQTILEYKTVCFIKSGMEKTISKHKNKDYEEKI
ncbi:MAG: NAD-dependent epimerase/dehydratase family protein [Vulcanibacillus sp.]